MILCGALCVKMYIYIYILFDLYIIIPVIITLLRRR